MKFLRDLRNCPSLRWLQALLCAILFVSLTVCAAEPRLVNHSLGFDARRDSPDLEILDYRYGNSNFPGVRGCPKHYLHCDKIPQGANTNGGMQLGDELYVKWRIKTTGEVYEDTVNLVNRLPADMHRQRIYFIASGPRLYIFLISPEKLDPNPCPSREERRRLDHSTAPVDKVFSMYCSQKITAIYPDQPTSIQSK